MILIQINSKMNFKEKEVVRMQKIILATKSDHKIKEIQMYIKNHKKYDLAQYNDNISL